MLISEKTLKIIRRDFFGKIFGKKRLFAQKKQRKSCSNKELVRK